MDSLRQRPLRVLAADDSAVMRRVLKTIFDLHADGIGTGLPAMELCGCVRDGMECLEAAARLRPDVLLLDLEMPRLNGIEVLQRLREQGSALPVIMCSAYTEVGARSTLEALHHGAKDYVMKPGQQCDFASALDLLMGQLMPKIAALALPVAASGGSLELVGKRPALPSVLTMPARPVLRPVAASAVMPVRVEVVVIGVSTGGPSALEQMLPGLAKDFPVPVLVVQHMPKLFTGALAERLQRRCAMRVKEGVHGEQLEPGTIWIAPGDAHMEVGLGASADRRRSRAAAITLHYSGPLNHCRPSVDYLFGSAAKLYGAGTLALMMTGMGSDGLEGALAIHRAGGVVLAQDQASSAVWGMPGQVARAGIAAATLPLGELAGELMRRVYVGRRGAMREPALNAVGETAPQAMRREASYGVY
ncbi:two-component system, chemotaxis family, response regulator CheB [Granulicella rosea]|uniref:Protein-glutamate methylesterase/protein-glutamine glutaminase n=1 Tax=Granulicella rosea TaxID=474952 RepID=A0A239DZJ7_9BACT|nr:chemotaxis-specific protein-glutamate methyltransferase CheB [Granulicella rosea]SNS37064.1 two-component system, chemotaxis family, response regulator CheB [Granulicella rosea]